MISFDPYKLSSFYPKVKNLVKTSYGSHNYVHIVDVDNDETQGLPPDTIIDTYVGSLRSDARRSRGNKIPDSQGMIAEVNYFKISRAVNILKFIEKEPYGKKLVDMSAGWGDRLIASLSLGIEYTGFDPSMKMGPIYQQMINDFSGSGGNSSVTTAPFEDVELQDNYYDLAFSSPPFYDVEIYNDEDTQSIVRYPDFVVWMREFLLPSLSKLVMSLKEKGKLALHFYDTKTIQMAEPFILYLLSTFKNLNYIGAVGVGKTNFRPVWIFQKVPSSLAKKYPDNFSYYFPILAGYPLIDINLNPNIVIKSLNDYYIIDDSLLYAGTKQRAIITLLSHNTYADRFLYAGSITSNECLPIAYACNLIGKNCLLYLQGYFPERLNVLKNLGAHVVFKRDKLSNMTTEIQDLSTPTDYVIPYGLDNVIYTEALYKALSISYKFEEPGRCWMVASTGVLLRVLSKLWPNTHFLVVEIGFGLYRDTFSDDILNRCTFFKSSYRPTDKINYRIPYNTVYEYDGKVWEFIPKHGRPGDFIWNGGK